MNNETIVPKTYKVNVNYTVTLSHNIIATTRDEALLYASQKAAGECSRHLNMIRNGFGGNVVVPLAFTVLSVEEDK